MSLHDLVGNWVDVSHREELPAVVAARLTPAAILVHSWLLDFLFEAYKDTEDVPAGTDINYHGNDCFISKKNLLTVTAVLPPQMLQGALDELRHMGIMRMVWFRLEPDENGYECHDIALCEMNRTFYYVFEPQYWPIAQPSRIKFTRSSFHPGYVYILEGGGYYKIGKSSSLTDRQKLIGVQMPFETTLVHAIATNTPLLLEMYWHQQFAEKRANGEWFWLSDDDLFRLCLNSRMEVGV